MTPTPSAPNVRYAAECWCGLWVNADSYPEADDLARRHRELTGHSAMVEEWH